MHPILKQLLRKKGIEKIEELSLDEKLDFERWNTALNTEDIKMEDLVEFLKSQKSKTEDKLADHKIPKEQRLELLPYLSVYKALLALIETPKVERELAERSLEQLLKQ